MYSDGVRSTNCIALRACLLVFVFTCCSLQFGSCAEYVLNKKSIRVAVIGDHGLESAATKSVAEMVTRWDSTGGIDAVISTGDVNYPRGSRWTIDANVGQYWREFMFPYKGRYKRSGPPVNRFWPCPGNHDYANKAKGDLSAYLDYMPVRRRRFYDIRIGPVHFFSLDSMYCKHEVLPLLNSSSAALTNHSGEPLWRHMRQAHWLYKQLKASTAPWKIVYFHHPPYSSGSHGSSPHMRWPFQEWGATAVLSGHDHSYERVLQAGTNFPFFINGMGGAKTYGFQLKPEKGSVWRFTSKTGGAQLIEANVSHITFQFYSTTQPNNMLDCYSGTLLDSPQMSVTQQRSADAVLGAGNREALDAQDTRSTLSDTVQSEAQDMHELGEPARGDSTLAAYEFPQNDAVKAVFYRDCRLMNLTNILGDFEPYTGNVAKPAKFFRRRQQRGLLPH